MFKTFLPKSDSIYGRAKTQPLILLDLGKLIPKVKKKKKRKKKKTTTKLLRSQLKSFKGTDVSCLLKLGLLVLINRAYDIFLLNLLCLYPKLRIAKSSRVTRA